MVATTTVSRGPFVRFPADRRRGRVGAGRGGAPATSSSVTVLAKLTPTPDGYWRDYRDDRFPWVREEG